jgi:predicted dehydrogenase
MAGDLKAGVIGAGVFGGYHANKYMEVDGAELVAIFDNDLDRAAAAARERGATRGFDDLDAFLEAVDILTIATPASTHGELAARALEAGRHVLVEKPIALDLETADRLVALARRQDLVLQVGHQERYVAQAFGLFDRDKPVRIKSRRLNRFSGRAMDVSVVFDLMIHDLDLLAQFVDDVSGAEVSVLDAVVEHGPNADQVAVDLRFPNGIRAQLSASRLEETPLRDLSLTYADGEIVLDFLERRIRNTTGRPLARSFDDDAPPLELADPLRFGTQRFVDSVLKGALPPVTGGDGRRALALGLKVEEAVRAYMES